MSPETEGGLTYYARRSYEIVRTDGAGRLSKAARKVVVRRILRPNLGEEHVFKLLTFTNHVRNRIAFDRVAPPYEPITVDVTDVEWRHPEFNVNNSLGQVADGEWDAPRNLEPIEREWIVDGLTERFQEGKPWRETRYVRRPRRKYFDDGESRWGCETVDEFIDVRCSYVERIYEDIKENGYEPESSGGDNDRYDGKPAFRQRLEPLVLIGRDGEVIWGDGFHRYAFATLLDIDEIPVQVAVRHRRWQELRDEIHENGGTGAYGERIRDHPDLRDVLD